MNYLYYIYNGTTWVECTFNTYVDWKGKKYKSLSNVLNDLNNGTITVPEKKYLVSAPVKLTVEASSLEEAEDILYKKLKSIGLEVGNRRGYEIPDDNEANDLQKEAV